MLLKNVKLQNIRSYENQSISFTEGSTLLSGDIGAGKSTILLAVEFALFGLRRKHLDGSSLLRHGKDEGSVELKIEVDKKEIIIKRKLKKGKNDIQQSTGYIIVDGKKKECTAVELKTSILEMLGYPGELVTKTKNLIYRYTVYTPQEEMKHILLEEGRLDTLRKVFGIDRYKRIRENSQILLRDIKEKIKVSESKVVGLEEKKDKVKGYVKEKDVLVKDKEDTNNEIESIKKSTKEFKVQEIDLEKRYEKYNRIKNEIDINDERLKNRVEQNRSIKENITETEKEIFELKDKLSSIKVDDFDEKEIRNKEKDIARSEEVYNKIIEKESMFKHKLEYIQESISRIKDEIKESETVVVEKDKIIGQIDEAEKSIQKKKQVEEDLNDKEEKYREITKEMHIIETKKDHADSLKQKIMGLKECPTCLQKVSEEHKENVKRNEAEKIKEIDKDLMIKKAEHEKVKEEISSLKEKVVKINEDEKVYSNLKIKLKNIEQIEKSRKEKEEKVKELERSRQEIVKISESIEDKERILEEIKEKKKDLNNLYERQIKKKEKEHIKKTLEDKEKVKKRDEDRLCDIKKDIGRINSLKIKLSEEIIGYKDSKDKLEKIRQDIKELDERVKEFKVKETYIDKDIERLKKDIERKDKEIEEMEEIKRQVVVLKQMRDWVDKQFVNLMAVIEKHVMLNLYSEFNDLFKKWFGLLIEDETMQARIDENFGPVIVQNGYDIEVNNLSGGEKTAAALAYRLSLNKVINDMTDTIKTKDIIILDEPTDGFSDIQLDKVRDVLDELGVRQTIIVSHENKIESFVDKVISITKDEHVSSIDV